MISSRKKREDFIEIEQIECIYFLDKNGYWDERSRLEKKVKTVLRLNELSAFTSSKKRSLECAILSKKEKDFIEIECIYFLFFDKNAHWNERFRLEKKVETSLRLNRLNGFTSLSRMVIGTNDLV